MPENSAPRSTLITTAVLVIALAAVFFVGKSIGGDDNKNATPTASSTETFGVVTSGQASVSAKPDQLTFTASVHNTKSSTVLAMNATNEDVTAVTTAAKKAGVDAKDIQTPTISVRAAYQYGRYGRHLVGYVASEQVKILVRNLDKAGQTIGAVTAAAGNAVGINGVSLSISNQDKLIAQARTAAVKKSKEAAIALAKAAGQDVGKLEYVEEVQPQNVYRSYYANDAAALAPASVSGLIAQSVAVSPGKKQLSVTVRVRWALAD